MFLRSVALTLKRALSCLVPETYWMNVQLLICKYRKITKFNIWYISHNLLLHNSGLRRPACWPKLCIGTAMKVKKNENPQKADYDNVINDVLREHDDELAPV